MSCLKLLFTYWGPMNTAFGTAPVDMASWAAILGVSAGISIRIRPCLNDTARRKDR